MASTITKQDDYDAFVFPDGFVMYRHEAQISGKPYTQEQIESAHIQVYQKGTPEWEAVTAKDRGEGQK